jgi:hypothetical protein
VKEENFFQRRDGQGQMKGEETKDRYRGSPKVRFERGKIVFDSRHREARGRQKLKKSE